MTGTALIPVILRCLPGLLLSLSFIRTQMIHTAENFSQARTNSAATCSDCLTTSVSTQGR